MTDPREELHTRLSQHAASIGHISITWNASDGGPRMDVELKTASGDVVDRWNDWMIMGSDEGPTGCEIITNIVRSVFSGRVSGFNQLSWSLIFTVSS